MSDSVNRRRFLGQTAAMTAAGIAAPAILSAANKAPSKKVTIGIMGMQRGLALAKIFGALDGVEIKYVCDTDDTRLTKAVKTVEKATKKAPNGWRFSQNPGRQRGRCSDRCPSKPLAFASDDFGLLGRQECLC